MADSYSLYDAKARLSEIVRQVREGATITITYRGKPVAEIKAIQPKPPSLEERLRYLEQTGQLVPAKNPHVLLKPIAKRPGALKRFLRDRSRF